MLRESFRKKDIIGRIGGDEFLVLVKDIKSQASAEKKAQDFIKRIQHINNKQEVRYLSCSIGICISNHRINTYEQMVASADRVLYNAKGDGKGRVYCCQVE